jgi:heptosyltransferase-2
VKFLIIRFSSIGDIILTTPVIRMLKKQFPHSEIHYVTKQSNALLVNNNPYIDKVHLLEDSLHNLIDKLKQESYDFIIDLHRNFRSLIIKICLGKKSFSFSKLNFRKWLLVNFKKDCLPNVHIVDRYLDTLKKFKVESDNNGLDFFIPSDIDIGQINHINEAYVVLVLGANHYTKRMPFDKLVYLSNSIDKQLIALGGNAESDIGKKLSIESSNVLNLCGKLDIYQSAKVLQNASLVITGDTGLMHISSALKKNIISVWGNTVPEFGMFPYFAGEKSAIFEVNNLKCRPCSKIGFQSCPKKHFHCMNGIDYGSIISYINSIDN